MRAHISTEPVSILLTPESKEDHTTLTALMASIDRRPFVAVEVADIIAGETPFGGEPQPSGVRIQYAAKQAQAARIADLEQGLATRNEIDALMSAQAAAQPVLAIENWPRVVELKAALVEALGLLQIAEHHYGDEQMEAEARLRKLAEGKP